jgi:[ribosomal protein S5]-alanine N-acetyltransferase
MTVRDLSPPSKLETARLILRRPDLRDAGQIFSAYASDPAVVRFLAWRPHADLEETRDFLRSRLEQWNARTGYSYVLAPRAEPRRSLGMVELGPTAHGAAFGYVLGRAHWGQGLMPEALSSLVAWALGQRQVWRAYAFCDVDNHASARVMEKAGMTLEGTLRRWFVHPNISPEPRDCRVYARVR